MTEEQQLPEIAQIKKTPHGWSIAVNLAVIATCGGLLFETRNTSDALVGFREFAASATETLKHLNERVEDLDNTRDIHRREMLDLRADLSKVEARQDMVIERVNRLEGGK